jgi:hypothetical protein
MYPQHHHHKIRCIACSFILNIGSAGELLRLARRLAGHVTAAGAP